MYAPAALLVLAAASVSAAGQGWALSSDSAPSGLSDCGGSEYCPAGTFCFDAKNSEVASCCESENQPCVGEIEGKPNCADPAWTMYSGVDNNGFCCEGSQKGGVDHQSRQVICRDSLPDGYEAAKVLIPGTGKSSTPSSSSSASSSASATSSSNSSSSASSTSAGSSSSPTSSESNDANTKGMAMGLLAAGFMAVAAL